MKKIVFALMGLLVLVSIDSRAQISISKKGETKKLVTLMPMAMNYWLYEINGEYLLTFKSSNQFDEDFWINLGNNKESVLKSLNDLSGLVDTIEKEDSFEIKDRFGVVLSVRLLTALGARSLMFTSEGRAGSGELPKMIITKAISWVDKNLE